MILPNPVPPWEVKTVPNRTELLTLVPKHSEVAEVGVLNGDFSEEIFRENQPFRLWLLDWWHHEFEMILNFENPDGTFRSVLHNPADCYPRLVEKYKDLAEVVILRGVSYHVLSCLAPQSLDMIYIDADHSYEGCSLDLEAALPKIKPGGWLMGHDYCAALPEVVKAVNEFCVRRRLQIDYITEEKPAPINHTEDFCAFNSFAIRV